MKFKIICICEYCGKEYEDKDKIKLCEASHLGLTVKENGDYYNMKCNLDIVRHMVEEDNSDYNKSLLETIDKELRDFEDLHNIPNEFRYE